MITSSTITLNRLSLLAYPNEEQSLLIYNNLQHHIGYLCFTRNKLIMDNHKRTLRDILAYKLAEYEGAILIESEYHTCTLAICAFLNSNGIEYKLLDIQIEVVIQSDIEDSVTVLQTELTLTKKHLPSTINREAIIDSLDSCKVYYLTRRGNDRYWRSAFILVHKEDIIGIDFKEDVMRTIIENLTKLINHLNTVDNDSLEEVAPIYGVMQVVVM